VGLVRYYPDALTRLLTELQRLPGIGPKSAQRLAFHLLRQPTETARRLAEAVGTLHDALVACSVCGNITDRDRDPCAICQSPERDQSVICLVEEADDIPALERTGVFRGSYHVLGGVLSALNHVRPDDLRIEELVRRVEDGTVREVIFALNASVEGNATVTYVVRRLQPFPVRFTQIAYGIPVGSDLDYVDEVSLSRALEGRNEIG
jgi:recombination protein RecR